MTKPTSASLTSASLTSASLTSASLAIASPSRALPAQLDHLRRGSRLSTLWGFVLLSMLFRDMHEVPKKEFLERALVQVVPEPLFLAAGIVLTLALLMVPLNLWLSRTWGRAANLIVVGVIVLGIATNPPGDLDDYWFAAVELLGLLAIVRLAWAWPAPAAEPAREGRIDDPGGGLNSDPSDDALILSADRAKA